MTVLVTWLVKKATTAFDDVRKRTEESEKRQKEENDALKSAMLAILRDRLYAACLTALARGEITTDRYGRQTPKPAHGTANLDRFTSSGKMISEAVLELYDRIIDHSLLVRRMYLGVNHVLPEQEAASRTPAFEQLDLFTDYAAEEARKQKEDAALSKEKDLQRAMLKIRKKFGNNAIVKGVNMHEESTGRDRNKYIGGHKA